MLHISTTHLRHAALLLVGIFGIILGVTGALLPWVHDAEQHANDALTTVPAVRVFGVSGAMVPAWVSADSQLDAVVAAHRGDRPVSFAPSTEPGRTSEAVIARDDGSRVSVFVNPHLGGVAGERPQQSRILSLLRDTHSGSIGGIAGAYAAALLMIATFAVLAHECTTRRAHISRRTIAPFAFAYVFSVLVATPLTGGTIHTVLTALHVGWPLEADAASHHSTPKIWKHPEDPPAVAAVAAPRKIIVMQHDETGAMVSENVIVDPAPPASSTTSPAAETSPPRRGPPDPATLEWCGAVRGSMDIALPPISLASIALIAAERSVPARYVITLPATETSVFTVTGGDADPVRKAVLHLDQYEGTVLADVRYGDVRMPGRFATWLTAVHDGTAFGLANRIVVSLSALALVACSIVRLVKLRRDRLPETEGSE